MARLKNLLPPSVPRDSESLQRAAAEVDASLTKPDLALVAARTLTAWRTFNNIAGAIDMPNDTLPQCREAAARVGLLVFQALEAAFIRERLWHEIAQVHAEADRQRLNKGG
jgi:hypothetical protein